MKTFFIPRSRLAKRLLLLGLPALLAGCGAADDIKDALEDTHSAQTESGANSDSQSTQIRRAQWPAICGAQADAQWDLDLTQSELRFTSLKKSHVLESHRLALQAGSVDISGHAEVDLDLSTVDTGIEIRDERLKEHLFEVSLYPRATVSTEFSQASLEALTQHGSSISEIEFNLDLHGVEQQVSALTQVSCINAETVWVSSAQPLQIKAADFGLTDGVRTLAELAGLDSIPEFSHVDFNLVFRQEAR